MRKSIKIFVASMMVAVVMVVSMACSTREHIAKFYNSIEEFVADFGTKLEKVNPEDECCLFDEEVIQSSVEEILKCEIGDSYYKVGALFYRGMLGVADRYEYEGFYCCYTLLRQDDVICELFCCSSLIGENYNERYELLEQIVVEDSEIGVYQPIEESQGAKEFFATFEIETSFNYVRLIIYDEYTRENFTTVEFISLFIPIFESKSVLK